MIIDIKVMKRGKKNPSNSGNAQIRRNHKNLVQDSLGVEDSVVPSVCNKIHKENAGNGTKSRKKLGKEQRLFK